jgi:hypothetical protein
MQRAFKLALPYMLITITGIVAFQPCAKADIYRWIDASGIRHYSNIQAPRAAHAPGPATTVDVLPEVSHRDDIAQNPTRTIARSTLPTRRPSTPVAAQQAPVYRLRVSQHKTKDNPHPWLFRNSPAPYSPYAAPLIWDPYYDHRFTSRFSSYIWLGDGYRPRYGGSIGIRWSSGHIRWSKGGYGCPPTAVPYLKSHPVHHRDINWEAHGRPLRSSGAIASVPRYSWFNSLPVWRVNRR